MIVPWKANSEMGLIQSLPEESNDGQWMQNSPARRQRTVRSQMGMRR